MGRSEQHEYHANVFGNCVYPLQVSLKTFDALSGDLDDDVELTADWYPSIRAVCAMDQSRFLCYDEENALLRHAVLGKQVLRKGRLKNVALESLEYRWEVSRAVCLIRSYVSSASSSPLPSS